MGLKEMKEAIKFAHTTQFWRMAILWTFSLIISHLQLLSQTLFSTTKPYSYPPISPPLLSKHGTTPPHRPLCIITGVFIHLLIVILANLILIHLQSAWMNDLCSVGVTGGRDPPIPENFVKYLAPLSRKISQNMHATSGLGATAAYSLSLKGFFVVLVGRSTYRLLKVEEDIRRRNKDAQVKCFEVDVSSFDSILKFKISFQQWLSDANLHSSIQLLINNAGILATSSRRTAEGHDQMIATNYLGAFCLTKVLLPLLENSPVPSRIVNVTSFTHRSASGVQVDRESVRGEHFSKLKIYPCAKIYEYSKFCLLLFSYELHRQLALVGKSHLISVIAVDPGAVSTNIMREVPTYLSFLALFVLKLLGLLQSPATGARSILDAALAPPDVSGVYFFGGNGRTVNSSAISYNAKLAKELWATSCDLFSESHKASNDTSS